MFRKPRDRRLPDGIAVATSSPYPLPISSSPFLHRRSGFTFIEMVIVIVMLGILLGIAVPIYQAQILNTKESVLKHNLATIRERLDQFKADRNKYPSSLQELIEAGYLREIPEDPMTSTREWEEVFEDFDPSEPDAEPGIWDVRSTSPETGSDGRPYSEW